MACRLPHVVTPNELWELFDSGRDVVGDLPKDPWDADDIYASDPDAPGKSYCR